MAYAVLIVIALVAFAASLFAGALSVQRIERARHWASVPGQIASSMVRANGNGTYMPEISYTYVVDGTRYASDRLRPGGTPFFYSEAKAMAAAVPYQPGAAVTVRYDPRRPHRPAIELVPLDYWVLPLRIVAVAVLVGAAVLFVTAR